VASNTIELVAKLKDEMTSKFKTIDASMNSYVKGVGAAGAATLAMGAAILAVTKKFADMGGQIFDTAAGLQVSTDALQALTYTFRQAGGDASTFSVAVRGIDSFMRSAETGSAEYTDTLRKLGLGFEELQLMDHEQQFYAMSAAIKNVDDAQQRSVIAQQLFGRQYQIVLGTIMQTEGTLQDATQAFMNAGLGIPAEDIAAMKEFTNQWTTMTQRLQVAASEAIGPIIPVVEEMMDKFLILAEDALPGIVSAAGSLANVIGFLAGHARELTALIVGFGIAILGAEIRLKGFNASLIQSTVNSKAFGVTIGALKGIVGNLGLGLAIAFTVDQLFQLGAAMNDAHQANMSLADNLEQTAELLNTAVETGFMSAEEAAEQMRVSMDALAESASMDAWEEAALRVETERLAAQLSAATVNMDVYIQGLAGVSKASYDTALAQLEMQRVFASGVFGTDSVVTAGLESAIEQLRGLQAEAVRTQHELDKAFSDSTGDANRGSDLGAGAETEQASLKTENARADAVERAREARQAELDLLEQIADKTAAMLADVRADREEGVAHREQVADKLAATDSEQEAAQARVNNQLLSGAQEFGRIMLRQGEDWEQDMLEAIIRLGIEMGLNMILPGLGSFVSSVLPFQGGGEVRHAQGGAYVPDIGPYGDRHLYALERGERVIPREQVLSNGGGGRGTVSLNLSIGSMFSGASKTDLLRSADIIVDALRERGVTVG